MSIASLLDELAEAGVHLSLVGDDLRYQTEPGVSITPFRETIRAAKPGLLAELRAREELPTIGLDPTLRWVRVYCGPVEASLPPEEWDGQVPPGCGVPNACCTLGPCPQFTGHGRCWQGEKP